MGKGPSLKGLGLCRLLPSPVKKSNAKSSLAVQWLGRRTSTQGGTDSTPSWGLRSQIWLNAAPPQKKSRKVLLINL